MLVGKVLQVGRDHHEVNLPFMHGVKLRDRLLCVAAANEDRQLGWLSRFRHFWVAHYLQRVGLRRCASLSGLRIPDRQLIGDGKGRRREA